MKLCLLHSKPIFLTLLPSYSILAAFGELETQALQVDYAIWAAQKAVTKAKYEWEQAFTLMKELKLKPPLLTFRAWIWAPGTVQIIAQDKIPQTSRNICYLCKHFLVR
ncbi:protein SET DOMAIN GROUP 40-like isoform X4 [Gossypium arboreum]|uniref:protein SET DOMAIN GROUP 40-like isoform X4 n=1 Tax=Gossypium arboreum TaxID=29729 RepID=UPI0022F16E59|nr:protein SET DOMAIN GROUP 40-like isoform X4 [Gossypium arboreum]